jgi:hypothetical protein
MVIGNSADNKMLRIAYAVNRTDATNLKQMDSILILGIWAAILNSIFLSNDCFCI